MVPDQTWLDCLLPDRCVLCLTHLTRRYPALLCRACHRSLPALRHACRHCALALPAPGVCLACQQRPLTAGVALAPLHHTESARHLVHRLKFHHGMREGHVLACLMHTTARRAYRHSPLPEALVPVPVSWRTRVRRGHNQAAGLAHRLSLGLGVPFRDVLSRSHRTPQRALPRSERLRLPHHVFRLSGALPCKHIALIDDVLTTGSTVRAIIRQLEKQGVERIDVWTATRARQA